MRFQPLKRASCGMAGINTVVFTQLIWSDKNNEFIFRTTTVPVLVK